MAQSKLPSFLLTVLLLGTIATNSRVGDFLQSLQEYEIVYPRIVSNKNARNRRSTVEERLNDEAQEEPLFLEISNWTLKTKTNDGLRLSSNFSVEWVHSTEKRSVDYDTNIDCNLRQGSLESDARSFAVVTLCKNDVYALMLVNQKSFFVQPLANGQHVMYESRNVKWWSWKEDSNIVSVIEENVKDVQESRLRKRERMLKRVTRETTSYSFQEYYNLSGDIFDMDYPEAERLILYDDKDQLPISADDVETEQSSKEMDSEHTGYFSGPSWQKNKLPKRKTSIKQSSPRWLEMGIAADYSVIDFHGGRVQQYILALLNIVSAIYTDPSLESNMVLVIVRMVLYAEKKDGMVRSGDARRSLENVNKWNRKMLSLTDVRHDVAVWLTRLDIGGPSGYAPVSGVCDPARSCALNRDEGLTSAFIIAHEVAHILGLTHDGDESTGNVCGEEGSRGSVMAPMVAATFHHFYWSSCSKKEFHRRVRRWSCLLNQPNHDILMQLKATFRETFTMDEQCRMEFGEGYELCKSFEVAEPCSHLWCGNTTISQTCRTKKGPPLDGTLCGISKWCINGRCEFMRKQKFGMGVALRHPRDGGWSPWSAWEKCSRTCGIGVQCRSRQCNKPSPAYGGKYCSGPNDNCKLCELSKCSEPIDLRAQQCSRLANILHFERLQRKSNTSWLPYESNQESMKCQLICRSKESGELFYTRTNLIDGTPCSYGTTNICIQGECHQMGCDNILGSRKAFDMCGVCDGDDSTCGNVINKFQRKLRREITRVAVIPRTAYHLFMNITLLRIPPHYQDNLTIVVGDGRRRRNVQDNLASPTRDLMIVQGAAFRIQKVDNNTYSVRANGFTYEEVVILIVIPKHMVVQGTTIAIFMQYYSNLEEKGTKERYVWLFGGWSFCSASCGGGTRQKMIVCKDEKTGRIVARRKCSLATKPTQEIEKCNSFSCHFKWLPGPWESCSATCGSIGSQLRQLYCIHSEFNHTEVNKSNELEVYQTMVQPTICKSSPVPINTRECNRIPCPGQWIFTDWSSCSKSYGRGIQSRIARCVPPTGESFFSCDEPSVKTEIRSCSGHVTRAIDFSCWKDKNRFCSISAFKRYCKLAGLRRCCPSCKINEA